MIFNPCLNSKKRKHKEHEFSSKLIKSMEAVMKHD